MRPRTLEQVVGQRHLLSEGKLLERTIKADRLTSLIFYGPPGSGKTTLAFIISQTTKARFVEVNAVSSNIGELRKIIEEAKRFKHLHAQRSILFIDEIHHFNKAQQDILIPEVERGHVILIGATTHNPSFAINGPLLSRSSIFELNPLSEEEILEILRRAASDTESGFGKSKIQFEMGALEHIARQSCGDARRALTALEVGVLTTPPDSNGIIQFTVAVSQESVQHKLVHYDHDGDYHYDTASAFIKSVRGSDVDAAVYWLAKMVYAGEDPRFIARRLVILASEDIGNADPQALILSSSMLNAVEFVGMPEAQIILAQTVTYLALAPKSNASYRALQKALGDVKEKKVEEVPRHLRDASYAGAKRLEHGQGYVYPHSRADHYVTQEYIEKKGQYYLPTAFGYEKIHRDRMAELKSIGEKTRGQKERISNRS
ncbi:MAG: replication-associated recombination protein A [Candidatus Omnitrophica bacterium]|nr:replication-associated recombination protein A [Candidatus Omnitrophota bacterium]